MGAAVAARAGEQAELPPAAEVKIDFARDIKPILETSCYRCHGPEKPRGHFRLDSRAAALKGGDNGVDIIPGQGAESPLVRYVSGLEPEMQMPPPGKGEPLTTNQIALLRAWIDQDAPWEFTLPPPTSTTWISPLVEYTTVNGDRNKFREHYWQREGVNGGLEHFELGELIGDNGTFKLSGRLLRDDYQLRLEREENGLGFIHGGWDHYRKYYDDTGGFDPLLTPSVSRLDRDLHLDIGRGWVDFGLTLPDWPRLVVGYEYQYKQGNEATLQWGDNAPESRKILPSSDALREHTHILKFDLTDEIAGTTIEDSFRGEFYQLNTHRTNVYYDNDNSVLGTDNATEGYKHFQGANTLRLERRFNDWLFASGGYLYSRLNGDDSFSVNSLDITGSGPPEHSWQSPRITLEQESHVGNVNALLGPWDGLTVSTGVQAEWTKEQGIGNANLDETFIIPGFGSFFNPNAVTLISDLDTSLVEENLAFRYAKIPFTSLFAEARLREEQIGQFEELTASQQQFLRDTTFCNWLSDARVGFNTSPWTWASFSAHYRRYDDESRYHNHLDQQPVGVPGVGYSAFIDSRSLVSDEIEGRLALRPLNWLRTTLSVKLLNTDYRTTTDPASSGPLIITPGGELLAGRTEMQIYSLSTTFTPRQRLYLSTTLSWQHASTVTYANGSPAVVPYRGDTYSALGSATVILSQASDLLLTYSFSRADYSQNNFATGLPLGINYDQHALQAGLTRRLGRNVTAKLQYGFSLYNEPSSGGANNYTAQSVLGMVTVRLP